MRRLLANHFRRGHGTGFARRHGFSVMLLSVCCFWGCAKEPHTPGKRITYPDRKASASTPVKVMEIDLADKKFVKDYDQALIDKIEQKWNDLLEGKSNLPTRGDVVLQFRLSPDGNIFDVSESKNTAGAQAALICSKAILDSAPFPPWPEKMRQDLKSESRAITFTFHYH
jgi:hypothetical protein